MSQTLLEQSLGQLACDIPGATRIFHSFKLDFCCGGHKSLRDAALERAAERRRDGHLRDQAAFAGELQHGPVFSQAFRDRLALVARVERLTAEAEGRPINMPADIMRQAPQLAEDELALYQSRQNRLQSEQRTLGEQLRQSLSGLTADSAPVSPALRAAGAVALPERDAVTEAIGA